MSVSIEEAATYYRQTGSSSGTYFYLKFGAQYKDTLGPIIYIPTYIKGYIYKVIEEEALYNFSKVTDVIINEGYFKICNSAFAYCQNLKSVQIPNSVLTIEANVFVGSNQVILTFVSGNNTITFGYLTPISGIMYHRNNTMTIYAYNDDTIIPIYTNETNLIIFPKGSYIGILPLSDTSKTTKLQTNKNKPSCQKSKSPLNLLLITQMTIKK